MEATLVVFENISSFSPMATTVSPPSNRVSEDGLNNISPFGFLTAAIIKFRSRRIPES